MASSGNGTLAEEAAVGEGRRSVGDAAVPLSSVPSPPPASSLPGFLPWEDDPEMVSKYLDRKVGEPACSTQSVFCFCLPP